MENALSTYKENTLQAFDKLAADIRQHIQPCLEMKVSDNNSKDDALMAGKSIKTYEKRIEEVRKALVGPLNERVKQINAYAKKIAAPLAEAEMHLKGQLRNYEEMLEKQRQEAIRKAEEERKALEAKAAEEARLKREEAEMAAMLLGDEGAAEAQAQAEVEIQRKQAEVELLHKTNVREIQAQRVSGASKAWTFEIVDFDKVPREFLMVDEKAIRQAIREGTREIAGVRIFQETRVSFR